MIYYHRRFCDGTKEKPPDKRKTDALKQLAKTNASPSPESQPVSDADPLGTEQTPAADGAESEASPSGNDNHPSTGPVETVVPDMQQGFPIVGIGASAGGLAAFAAFEAFFSGMPENTEPGMAFARHRKPVTE